MNKYQTLAANTALISIGTFGLKVLVFLNPSHCKSIPPPRIKKAAPFGAAFLRLRFKISVWYNTKANR